MVSVLKPVMEFLLTKILWLRRSKWQFLLAGLAFLLGLTIMLSALEAYLKVQTVVQDQKRKGQFLIVNKKISLVNTLGLASSSFSKEEINSIRKNPVFKNVGFIQSNQFQASIRAKSYIDFYTMAFFESVSPGFLEVDNREFRWREGQKDLPIVVSQDFLNLYNFGFALSQGLPQVSRDAMKMVTFDVEVTGPGGKEVFNGKIVGFTERIASVLVPMSFMEWSNREIAQKPAPQPSRLIVKVESMSDPAIAGFLEKNRLVTDQERLQLGKSGSVLNTVMKVLALLGTVFITLALIMFSMNFKLILAEAAGDIRLLIELGYRHTVIGMNLLSYFALFVLVLFGLSAYLLFQANGLITSTLQSQGLNLEDATLPLKSLLAGAVFSISIVLINGLLIIRQLRQIA